MASKGAEFVRHHQPHHKRDYESLEGEKEWTGKWELNRHDMTWWRPELYYFRSARSGQVEQFCQLGRGPMVRPGPLQNVVHLDVPHAALHSHPETPDALPDHLEGAWADTNPAWPEASIDAFLSKMGFRAVWKMTSSEETEAYELVPAFVEGVDPNEAEPFDPTPITLSATQVYVRPEASATPLIAV